MQRAHAFLGAHFSIAKGLDKALFKAADYGCTALQVFTKNAGAWKERTLLPEEIDRFHQAITETGITEIASHTSYLINLAAPDNKKHAMSCKALKHELIRSSTLHIPYVVLHPGSHRGKGEKAGIDQIAESINQIFSQMPAEKPRLLLETTAGQGHSLGHTFEQIAAMMKKIEDKEHIGICLDTAHIFAAGYDIRTKKTYRQTMALIDAAIGIENIWFIHLNDSRKALGSRVDRHEHIGAGCIGLEAFECIMTDARFFQVPKVIETPKGRENENYDKINLERLKAFIRKA